MMEYELDFWEQLQSFLASINDDNANSIAVDLNLDVISNTDGINQLIHEIFFILSIRLNVTDALVKFTVAIKKLAKPNSILQALPKFILRNCERSKNPFIVVYIYKLVKIGFLNLYEKIPRVLYLATHDLPIARDIFAEELYNAFPCFFTAPINYSISTIEDGCLPGTIEYALKHDDIDFLRERSIEGDFSFNQTLYCSQLYHPVIRNQRATLLEAAALFGSLTCFKFLMLNKANFRGIVETAPIIGGNLEIIRLWDQNREIDGQHVETAMRNRRNDVIDWIIDTKSTRFTNEDLFNMSISANNAYFFNKYKDEIKVTSHMVNSSFNSRSFFAQKYLIENCIEDMSLLYANCITSKSVIESLLEKNPSGSYICDFTSSQISPSILSVLYSKNLLKITDQFAESVAKNGTKEVLAWLKVMKLYDISKLSLLETAVSSKNYDVINYLINLEEFKFDNSIIDLVLSIAVSKRILLIPFVLSKKISDNFRSFLTNLPFINDSNLTERAIYEKWLLQDFLPEHIPILTRFFLISEPCISTSSNSMLVILQKLNNFPQIRAVLYSEVKSINLKLPIKQHFIPVLEMISKMALDDLEIIYKNKNVSNVKGDIEKGDIVESEINDLMDVLQKMFTNNVITSETVIKKCQEINDIDFTLMMLEMSFREIKEPNHNQCQLLSTFYNMLASNFKSQKVTSDKSREIIIQSISLLPHCFPFETEKIVKEQIDFSDNLSDKFCQKFLTLIESKKVKLQSDELRRIQLMISNYSISNAKRCQKNPIIGVGLGEKLFYKTAFENISKNNDDNGLCQILAAMKQSLMENKWKMNYKKMEHFFDIKFDENEKLLELFAFIGSFIVKSDTDYLTEKSLESLLSSLKIMSNKCPKSDELTVCLTNLSESIEEKEYLSEEMINEIKIYLKDIKENQLLIKAFFSKFSYNDDEFVLDLLRNLNDTKSFLYCVLYSIRGITQNIVLEEIFDLFSKTVLNDEKICRNANQARTHSSFYTLGYSDSDYDIPSSVSVDSGVIEIDYLVVGILSEFSGIFNKNSYLKDFNKFLDAKASIMPSAERLLSRI
ncbi:hypothetical protein TVAG_367620 [Trichomonas vaginalis G3]|uniref:DUF3447 domain-containing protein n=1 Tax=Trichomonas vaginalis (strain ATCC PRA-98 / G3) TaxID=412133 RepID=A2F5R6_TRIV3|nr:spectrin binding [Trichomonas vaginalis G3]EAX99766.1 hypothetical protein TVAG_367620 [Trichomonas vaginalis G3]KAI5489051.1 spectrin binding [Trichomonas vaginalis G3]|eukprot:XP_001312696.1 hypothetical protein [Trichomonas vaginalis G3]